jgi:hypothetical protein
VGKGFPPPGVSRPLAVRCGAGGRGIFGGGTSCRGDHSGQPPHVFRDLPWRRLPTVFGPGPVSDASGQVATAAPLSLGDSFLALVGAVGRAPGGTFVREAARRHDGHRWGVCGGQEAGLST